MGYPKKWTDITDIKGLGNAVVPQIPYQLGKRIKRFNNF